jgi:hypothetical protein
VVVKYLLRVSLMKDRAAMLISSSPMENRGKGDKQNIMGQLSYGERARKV